VKISKVVVIACLLIPGAWLFVRGSRRSEILPADFVVMDYWEKWTGNEARQMQEIVDDFNRSVGAEKKIFVRYLSMTAVDKKTLVSTAAGVPPDLAGLWDSQVVQFADLDALEPLDSLAASYSLSASTYKKVVWDTCTYAGRLWALPSTPAGVALHYNKRVFRENAALLRGAGLDPNRAPTTIDELDRYAELLDTRDARGNIDRAGYMPTQSWYIDYTGLWFGGGAFDAESQRFTLTEPAEVRAFTWFQSYFKRMGAQACSEFKSGLGGFNSTQNPFLVDKLVMQQQGPWMANYIYDLKPAMSEALVPKVLEPLLPRFARPFNYDWGVAPFPADEPSLKDVTYCGCDVLVIPRGARHPREAFEFLAFVQRQDVMEKLCALHCKPSPLAAVSDDFVRNHLNPYINIFERLDRSPNAHPTPKIPIFPELADEMKTLNERLSLLKLTPEEALSDAQRRLEEKYSDYLARQRIRAARTGQAAGGALGSATP
jgi:ABC-type glycerol-3-phosphate transport system substrate-binding protein